MTRILDLGYASEMDPRNVPKERFMAVMRRYYEIAQSHQRDDSEGIHMGDFERAVTEIAKEDAKDGANALKNQDPNE